MIRVSLRPALLAGLALTLAASAHAAWLGVQLQSIDDDLRDALELRDDDGVLISEVADDSPAERAGLEDGDVILEIDGRSIDSAGDVVRRIGRADAGDEVTIEILRDGDRRSFDVELGDSPTRESFRWFDSDDDRPARIRRMPRLQQFDLGGDASGIELFFSRPRLGVETRALEDGLADYFDVDPGEGVLVLNVMDDTPAEEAGLEVGDVILRVDDEEIEDPGDLREALLDLEGEEVELEIKRHGDTRTLTAELDEPRNTWMTPSPSGNARFMLSDGDDAEELREELEELRDELRELREELRDLR